MTLPSGFRYQGVDWTIVVDDVELASNNNLGTTNPRSREVSIATNYSAEHQSETLLHEVLHVVEQVFSPEDHPSESHIRALALGIYALLIDNPDIRHFIWPES
jgi:hypothetical protein